MKRAGIRATGGSTAVLVGFALVALVACSSSRQTTKEPAEALPPPGPDKRIAERSYTAHFDALEARYLPHGEFAPGVEATWAPIHSGLNATLFFVGLRGKLPKYVNPEHEENFFIIAGSGTIDLAGGKTKPIEPCCVVRVPPGFAHGFTAAPGQTIEAVLVVAPIVTKPIAQAADADLPDAVGFVEVRDMMAPGAIEIPDRPNYAVKRIFDWPSKRSTLQLSAVQQAKIPDHRHRAHDETVIIFHQQGFGFLHMDEVVDPTQAIEIAHIPAGVVHGFEHKADGQVLAISIFSPGGYDGGNDVELVDDGRDVNRPSGYKQTGMGDFADPDKGKRDQIQLGPDGPRR